ncbi:DsrE family protein [Actimicrobium sp. CCI2.3]|uniref:DsrE family protein n=1 Tax=Actimicrobium sp. CCI2.3 TaxID=3048616 RepID=UPI002AB51137|nr:DsrE family protein [Actimicrobium sp. CCI2.3]MDY7576438.1 DsrE family protein [Actimicrobium sp. CCI2.3]MEB0021582.1 DsrE family protein [Actimicrobium sp. CCI2.3]
MRRRFLKAVVIGGILLAGIAAPALADEPVKVVYHLSDGSAQAARALANIRNHLRAAPDTRIVVVALADGIKLLLKDAADPAGTRFEPAVEALVQQGVQFRICGNTLATYDIAPTQVIAAATVVPSGVAEIARLQSREGYAYLRP